VSYRHGHTEEQLDPSAPIQIRTHGDGQLQSRSIGAIRVG
jgi:hypothetical protein